MDMEKIRVNPSSAQPRQTDVPNQVKSETILEGLKNTTIDSGYGRTICKNLSKPRKQARGHPRTTVCSPAKKAA
jgi:hypothetical protein